MAELETTVLVSEIEAIERAARRALDAYRDAIARAEAAEATLERVRVQHRVDQYTEGRAVLRCVCEEEWPCPTMAALDTGEGNGNAEH